MPIRFYSTRDKYGDFSNFSQHAFSLDGKTWRTSEHYFQAQKFFGTEDDYAEEIRHSKTASAAAKLGRSRKHKLRPDWEAVKDDAMRAAVLAKFRAHPDLRELLLSTGEEQLIEETTDDHYWGVGSTGTGVNRLGQILMEVRAILRSEPAHTKELP